MPTRHHIWQYRKNEAFLFICRSVHRAISRTRSRKSNQAGLREKNNQKQRGQEWRRCRAGARRTARSRTPPPSASPISTPTSRSASSFCTLPQSSGANWFSSSDLPQPTGGRGVQEGEAFGSVLYASIGIYFSLRCFSFPLCRIWMWRL